MYFWIMSKIKVVFHQVLIKLGEYVGGHNILTKFYYLPKPPGTPELWSLIVIIIEITTNATSVFCVSLAHLYLKYFDIKLNM